MRQRRRLGQELSYSDERFFELRVDRGKRQIFCSRPRDEDQIDPGRNPFRRTAERFARQSLDAIAHDRIPRFTGHHQAQARLGRPRLDRPSREHEHEVPDRHAPSVLEDAVELGLATDAPLTPEPERWRHFL